MDNMRIITKYRLFIIGIFVCLFCGCMHYGKFTDPKLSETYSGALTIEPLTDETRKNFSGEIDDIMISRPSTIVSIAGDGENISVHGLTGTMPFKLHGGGVVAGFTGKAVTAKEVSLNNFASYIKPSETNKTKYDSAPTITGTLILTGGRLYTPEGGDIIINENIKNEDPDIDEEFVRANTYRITFSSAGNTLGS